MCFCGENLCIHVCKLFSFLLLPVTPLWDFRFQVHSLRIQLVSNICAKLQSFRIFFTRIIRKLCDMFLIVHFKKMWLNKEAKRSITF